MSTRAACEGALLAYASRQISAETAASQICEAIALAGGAFTRCAVIADAADDDVMRLTGGSFETSEIDALNDAVKAAETGRLLLTRQSVDAEMYFDRMPKTMSFIAIEPMTTRRGVYVGSLGVVGSDDEAKKSHVLTELPRAARLCTELAFELLYPDLLARRIHHFNNLLAVVASNVAHIASAVDMAKDANDAHHRAELATCIRHATDGTTALLNAATSLRRALPIGNRLERS